MTQRKLSSRIAHLSFQRGRPLATGDRNENPKDLSLLELLREDYRTHGSSPLAAGFLALAVHRLGNARMDVRTAVVRAPLTLAYRAAYRGVIAAFGIDLPYNVKIGRRMRIGHHGYVVLGARAVGDDVVLHHSVTIGLARRTDTSTAPVIGDRVEVGPGACIVGDIEVGDDSYVGPNTVLADSIPAGTNVLGVPARIVNTLVGAKKPGDGGR